MTTSKIDIKELDAFIKNMDYVNFDSNEANKYIDAFSDDTRKTVQNKLLRITKFIKKYNDECIRVKSLYDFDRSFSNGKYVVGVDEVGRGPLAGPIVGAAVILDLTVLDNDLILELNDSKKLNEAKRERLSEVIKQKAIAYFISERSSQDIDEKGIAYCNNQIFLDSYKGLNKQCEIVLSDGYLVKNIDVKNEAVIKGDTKSATIAAASILAKVYRDNLMKEYHKKYPHYNFESNVGYGTKDHLQGIEKHGICEIHRKSFLKNFEQFF